MAKARTSKTFEFPSTKRSDDLWEFLTPKLKRTSRPIPDDLDSRNRLQERCDKIIATLTAAIMDANAIAKSIKDSFLRKDFLSPIVTECLFAISQGCIEEVVALSFYLPTEPKCNLRWLSELIDLKEKKNQGGHFFYRAIRLSIATTCEPAIYKALSARLPSEGHEWDQAIDKYSAITDATAKGKGEFKDSTYVAENGKRVKFRSLINHMRQLPVERKAWAATMSIAVWNRAIVLSNIQERETQLRTMFNIAQDVLSRIEAANIHCRNKPCQNNKVPFGRSWPSNVASDNPLSGLFAFARAELKGKQRRVFEMVLVGDGRCPLPTIASDQLVDWTTPFDDAWKSACKQINEKLIRAKQPFRLRRIDNSASLEDFPPSKVGQK